MRTGGGERVAGWLLRLCAVVPVVLTLGLVSMLARGAWTEQGLAMPPGGLAPAVMGTVLIAGLALLWAVPVGLAAAIYLAEFAPATWRRWLRPALELLAGVPTVIYALLAVWVVVPALTRLLPGLSVPRIVAASMVLALMLVPTVVSLAEDALRTVPRQQREAALALGASRLRMLAYVVLPAAAPGIVAAVMLALARAVGETMIMTLVAGRLPWMGLDPRTAVETLTGQLGAAGLGAPVTGSMYTAGAVLLLLSLAVHSVGHRLVRRAGRWS
ncbi:MAG: ABC transporter permease subunit [Deltaproteobacteria bacterium]|nr:ABC transporter permease subunit [Deltaproteobacteria bacterium]